MIGPVLYCGDPHGRFGHIARAAKELQPSAIVLLGDMEAQRPLELELEGIDPDTVYFIHGNHDTDAELNYDNLWGSRLAERNIDGRVVTLPSGLRLAGLGGVFRESVWYPTLPTEPKFRNRAEHKRSTPRQERFRGGVGRRHWSSIYPDELDRLAKLRADVLVTHEAPGYHINGFAILDTLAQSLGVKVAIHGHHHDGLNSSDRWETQGFRSYGVGLRGVMALWNDGTSSTVTPGELDDVSA